MAALSEAWPRSVPEGLVGGFVLDRKVYAHFREDASPVEWGGLITGGEPGVLVEGALSEHEVEALRSVADSAVWVGAGANGYVCKSGDDVGSWRATIFDAFLAQVLWQRLEGAILDAGLATRVVGGVAWQAVGVNPALRLIRYEAGGVVLPHYDGPFVESAERESMLTLVVYLSDTCVDGGTRFLFDTVPDASYADWLRAARDDEVCSTVSARSGDCAVFAHRILHEAPSVREPKLVIRSDIMFEKVL
jgi:hypothetical protein